MGLRKGQKELVEQYRGGYCAVPAIPGGGKTHCLSQWAVEMISKGLHKPGRILIVTYMNSAVNNFKQRISAELQSRGIEGEREYHVSTIHGLCLQIIRDKPEAVFANEEFEVVDGAAKGRLILSSVEEWKRRNEDKFKFYIDQSLMGGNREEEICQKWEDRLCSIMLSSIGDFKYRGISPEQAKEKCRSLGDNSILTWAAEIYGIYERKLKMGGLLDFDDMLYNAKMLLLQDNRLLEKYSKIYSFVCEDEAQDSNLIQNEVLTMIARGNLLRVGDSNQAICGSFTSSDFTFFKNFCLLPQTKVYNITQSSRNTREIINLANYFVNYVRESHPVSQCRESLLPQYIEAVGDEDERKNPVTPVYGIKAAVFGSWEEEAEAVVVQALRMIKKHPHKTIAILVPTGWRIAELVKLLEARNVPFEELDNSAGERNSHLRRLGRTLDFIAHPESSWKLADFMNELLPAYCDESGSGKREVELREKLLEYIRLCPTTELLYPDDGFIQHGSINQELLDSRVWNDFVERLQTVREILEYPLLPVEKLILHISDVMEFDKDGRAIAHKVANDARYISAREADWELDLLAAELLKPRNVFSYFAGLVWELKGYEPRPGVITVSTYHKSKGMEWDIVFLTGLNNADFPVRLNDRFIGEHWFLKQEYKNPQAIAKAEMEKISEGTECVDSITKSKIETISERARLLYVGITRARNYLFLSGFHANAGRKNEMLPSAYLLEIKRYIEEVGK